MGCGCSHRQRSPRWPAPNRHTLLSSPAGAKTSAQRTLSRRGCTRIADAAFAAMRHHYGKLCDEIRDRSMTTSVMTASAEEILAATAHELRLPLSHIKGFVSSLQRTDVEWDEQRRRELITEIDLATDHLTGLVDSLLAARAPGAHDKPCPDMTFTEPAAVLEGAFNRVGLPGKRPLRIDVPSTLPSIRMNASQMERVVVNLVENAIKYSTSGTPIGISARVTRDGELRLSVEDEGPGVPLANRERIFDPFFRNQMARKSI